MPPTLRTTWSDSLRLSFRLIPQAQASPHLQRFLESDGRTAQEIYQRLDYEPARARGAGGAQPDWRRYRAPKEVYETVGLLCETTEHGVRRVRLTDLGKATHRWLPTINEHNAPLLGKHAAYALAACQLRNPIGAGATYRQDVMVFPFAFIWRAMLALEDKISSDELNRAIFKVKNAEELERAIVSIREARAANDLRVMGDETITGTGKNDRIIPWMSFASFGWTLFREKRAGEARSYYTIPERMRGLLEEASLASYRHREFSSVEEYVKHISAAAALPEDLR